MKWFERSNSKFQRERWFSFTTTASPFFILALAMLCGYFKAIYDASILMASCLWNELKRL